MPEASPVASAAPQPQQGQSQGAPFGSSPATGPTPNKGFEAAGLQRLGMAVKILTETLPMVGVSSEIGQALMAVLPKLAKFVPAGTSTPASERNAMEQMMMRNVQQGGQMQQLRAQMGQQGGGGAPGGGTPPGGGGMPGMKAA